MDAGAIDGGVRNNGCQAGAACAMGRCTACPTGQVACDNQCVDLGASDDHCGACGARCPAGQVCTRGGADGGATRCTVLCPMGQTVCGGACVTVATDVGHCGACDNRCAARIPSANTACMSGVCRLVSCLSGFDDCDGVEANGCEVGTATDPNNCGSCGARCALANATSACAGGRCVVGACAEGFRDCNGNPADGCETDVRTAVVHCGACGNVCSAPTGRTPFCNDGACDTTTVCAASGLADCDGNGSCETDLTRSVAHCGGCGRPCSGNGGVPTCGGTPPICSIQCGAGFGNCDNDVATGCETNTNTNILQCGACGNRCDLPNASESCIDGVCRVISCGAGFANCDARDSNGCEQALLTDTANCGACGNRCRSGESCQGGACVCPVAEQTYCAALSRCVDLLVDNVNCGACGNVCTGGQTCQSGTCRCVAGQTHCAGVCFDLQTNVSHCGICNAACSLANAQAGCVAGGCIVARCAPGFTSCDGDHSNGCETNTGADSENCGRCGTRCGAGRFCSGSTCVSCGSVSAPACQPGNTCSAGVTVCNGTCRDLQADGAHCGACGRACAAGQSCCAGVCRSLATDTGNCGMCGRICPLLPNASPACVGGQCGLGPCNAGLGNCDMNAANGCEVGVGFNDAHCGACGNACTSTQVCHQGVCRPCGALAGQPCCSGRVCPGMNLFCKFGKRCEEM